MGVTKKCTIVLGLLLLCVPMTSLLVSVKAENTSTLILQEDFEDAFPPSGWATYAVGSGWYQSSSYSHTGTYCAYHTYEYTSCDDWLVTPQFTVPDGAVLTFWERTYYDSWYVYHGIWISTGSGDPADGDFVELMEDNAATGGTWVQTTVDLSAYAGQKCFAAYGMGCLWFAGGKCGDEK